MSANGFDAVAHLLNSSNLFFCGMGFLWILSRGAATSYTWSYKLYKWPKKYGINGVIGVITVNNPTYMGVSKK